MRYTQFLVHPLKYFMICRSFYVSKVFMNNVYANFIITSDRSKCCDWGFLKASLVFRMISCLGMSFLVSASHF